MTTRFETPTRYVAGTAYCASTGLRVSKARSQWGTAEQGAELIETLTGLLGEADTRTETDDFTVVVIGSDKLWYVVGFVNARPAAPPNSSVWLQTYCRCHAREIAAQLAKRAQPLKIG